MDILRKTEDNIERLQWVKSHPERINPDRYTWDEDGIGIDRADSVASRDWELFWQMVPSHADSFR